MKWYVLHVVTGKEVHVRNALQRIGLEARAIQEIVTLRKGGKWVEQLRTIFSGYVFLGCNELDNEIYYAVKQTMYVINILGTPKPQSITEEEAAFIGTLAPDNDPLTSSVLEIQEGRPVVVSGPLKTMPAQILSINVRQRRAVVKLTLLDEPRIIRLGVVLKEEQTRHLIRGKPIDDE